MSVLARQVIRGSQVRITRPVSLRQNDGSRNRVGLNNGTPPDAAVLQPSVTLHLTALTVQRRELVFGAKSEATDTIRANLAWRLQPGDQLEVLAGAQAGERYRIEQTQDHGLRPRMAHTECALVRLPGGTR